MNGRTWVRVPGMLGLLFALVLGSVRGAEAQSPTQEAVACVEAAADELKKCVDDLPWYAEALCYARYASDGILCAPSVVLKAL